MIGQCWVKLRKGQTVACLAMLELENAKFLAEAATGALSNHMPAGHGDRSNAGRARLCSRAEQARRQYGGGASHQGRGRHQGVQADSITMAAESGGEITAQLLASTKILHVPPGEKDLKNATVLQAQDLHPGDRVLVRGQASADGHTIAALAVIVMTQADLSAKQQHDREDWQKRGVAGWSRKWTRPRPASQFHRAEWARATASSSISQKTRFCAATRLTP